MKFIILILGSLVVLMGAFGQTTFRLEPENSDGDNVENELNVPKGSVAHDPDGEHVNFTSEDGKVQVRVPRSDLVKPTVKSDFTNGIYTYVITNDISAKRPVEIIRLLENGGKIALTQVSGDFRFIFSDVLWISGDSGGLRPGQTMTLKVTASGAITSGPVVMQFMNGADLYELPQDTPYGLRVLMRNYQKAHEYVGVPVVGPK